MKRKLLFLMCFSAITVCAIAQNDTKSAPLQFDSYEWDFGKIEEKDGVVSHTFYFANKSDAPVTIDDVSTSCGCTTTSYSTKPIAPGEISQMTINFNPARTDGKVFREIELFTNGHKFCNRLMIIADVIPAPLTIEQLYPQPLAGDVRTVTMRCNFGFIAQGRSESKSMTIVNNGSKSVKLDIIGLKEKGILTAEYPPMLSAGKADGINLTYHIGTGKNSYGTVRDTLWLVVDGKKSDKPFIVSAVCTDDFSKVDKETAPGFRVQPALVDFGYKARGKVFKETITIGNTGKSDLIFHDIECGNGANVDLKEGTVFKPGEERNIAVYVMNSYSENKQTNGYINITTNDPERPIKELRLQISTK